MTCVPKQACESVGSCVYAQGQGASEDLFGEGKDGGRWEGIRRGGVVRAEDGAHTGEGLQQCNTYLHSHWQEHDRKNACGCCESRWNLVHYSSVSAVYLEVRSSSMSSGCENS